MYNNSNPEMEEDLSSDSSSSDSSKNLSDDEAEKTSSNNTTEPRIGCEHYRRNCQFVAPCCGKVYTCRFCHDENEKGHQINRRKVMEVQCLLCKTRQPVSNLCISCNTTFGGYFCPICRLYDNDDKKQFHCDECGICRIGGRARFFHCNVCGLCMDKSLENNHKCIENVSKSNCPVCLEDIHSSRISSHKPPCGHMIHSSCYQALLENGNYTCPVCNTSMVDMGSVWNHLDEEVASTPMPTEYEGFQVAVLCRDCHKDSQAAFHLVGLKCAHCGSYNTTRTTGGLIPVNAAAEADAEEDTRESEEH